MPTTAHGARTLFLEAIELDQAARHVLFDRACRGNIELRRDVEELLAAHDEAGEFLASPPLASTVPWRDAQPVDPGGGRIGPYRLVEPLGAGGMGVVFRAEQTEPIHREVALKVIRPGLDSAQVVARFEAERQALAIMDHPNIARVYEAGTTGAGRPYFVMELAIGEPITSYCDRHRLSLRERLELFVLVCRAVQHAHQKGVIHRDLKPSNVLVVEQDGAPVPKVIDFGVAKAVGLPQAASPDETGWCQVVGTPLYMSPEQADPDNPDVDTRSDIYSLGVLLYELLAGLTPLDPASLQGTPIDRLCRLVHDQTPPAPSSRLCHLGRDEIREIAVSRRLGSRRLAHALCGELDWIALRCLERDRARRYPSAAALADDLMRHLTDRPVEAGPPSRWYRSKKFVRRNRIALAIAGLFALSLVAGMAASLWQAAQATAARRQAEDHLAQGFRAVEDLYNHVAARDLTALRWSPLPRPFLVKVLPFYERFASAPRVDVSTGRAHLRVGEILIQLGRFDEADAALARSEAIGRALMAVDPRNPAHPRDLAACLYARGELPSAWEVRMRAHEEALALRQRLVDCSPSDPAHRRDLADSHATIAGWMVFKRKPGAEEHLQTTLRLRERLVAENPQDPDLLSDLGTIFQGYAERHGFARRNAEAETYARRSLALQEKLLREHPTNPRYWQRLTWALCGLAPILLENRKDAEAAAVVERAVTMTEALVSDRPEHGAHRAQLADILGFRVIALSRLGDRAALDRALDHLLGLADRWGDAGTFAYVVWNLVQTDVRSHPNPEATLKLARRAMELDPESVQTNHSLGMALYRAGRWDEAIPILHRTNELEGDGGRAFNGFFIAMCHERKGDPARAREWYERSVAWMVEKRLTDPNAFKYRDEAAAVLGLAPGPMPNGPASFSH